MPQNPLKQKLKYHENPWGENYQHGISYGLSFTSPMETIIAEIHADGAGWGGSGGKDTVIPNLSQL